MRIRDLAILGIIFFIIMAITIYMINMRFKVNPVSAFYLTIILLIFTLIVEFIIGHAMFKSSF